ncbi:UNVERIFIED_CONTAM: hypothetical protein K2H54_052384 [Gekko kuhli]
MQLGIAHEKKKNTFWLFKAKEYKQPKRSLGNSVARLPARGLVSFFSFSIPGQEAGREGRQGEPPQLTSREQPQRDPRLEQHVRHGRPNWMPHAGKDTPLPLAVLVDLAELAPHLASRCEICTLSSANWTVPKARPMGVLTTYSGLIERGWEADRVLGAMPNVPPASPPFSRERGRPGS